MWETLSKHLTRVPPEHKRSFYNEIFQENLFRILVLGSLLSVSEACIYIFYRNTLNPLQLNIMISIILVHVIILPIIFHLYRKNPDHPNLSQTALVPLYAIGIILWSAEVSLVTQPNIVVIGVYILGVFAVASLLYLQPITSLLIFLSVYMLFFIRLPYFQTNPNIVIVHRIDGFVMTTIAWVLNRMIFRLKISAHVDKKILEAKNEELSALSIRDSMTKLFNHAHAYEQLILEMKRISRHFHPMSVILFDIDHFKHVNDTYGHQVGDLVIIQIAEILKRNCRQSDIIGRYGGEEFILILPDTKLEEAYALAERIRIDVAQATFPNNISVTISGGVSTFNYESAFTLVRIADEMLYKAKENGRNRVEVQPLDTK